MFLAIDESIASNYTVLGCLVVPYNKLPEYERDHIRLRLKQRVWAEVKWNKITSAYFSKYKALITGYLSNNNISFHSWAYRNPTRVEINKYYQGHERSVIYKHAYLLIRTIIWKCRNNGYNGPFYIVADTTGSLGEKEYQKTRRLLSNDSRIKPRPVLDFCAQGNSQICGALQVCDVCTGATRYAYQTDPNEDPEAAGAMMVTLKTLNNNVSLNYSHPTLPNLTSYKIHHCFYDHSKAGRVWVLP